jgi:hypothetical protein
MLYDLFTEKRFMKTKADLTQVFKHYYTCGTKPELHEFGAAEFLAIRGSGDPSAEAFQKNIEALYSVAYTVKFMSKANNHDFVVAKLEGLWWYDEVKFADTKLGDTASQVPRSEWEYHLMIRMPDFINEQMVRNAISSALQKKGNPFINNVEYFTYEEGLSVQMLHVGPFETENKTLEQIAAFMTENNLLRNGVHHEIYLSDFRKTKPEKLKTILREPVRVDSEKH